MEKTSVTNEYGYTHQTGYPAPFDEEEKQWLAEKGVNTTYTYGSGIEVPIHPSCVVCQARNIIKYEGHPNLDGKKPFIVNCKGIAGALPPGSNDIIKRFSTEKNMSYDRAKLLIRSAIDPVAWCELMFGFNDQDSEWNLRWYQKEVLRCSAKRIVLRLGRRSGKSFSMALKLLYEAFTQTVSRGLDSEGQKVNSGPQIIIATPFQAQLTNLFDEMEKLLKRNIDLSNKVKSKHGGSLYTKSPFFLLELTNGATISGFVTGVEIRQDGSAAGSLRGQNANTIYIDEMDMIPEEVLEKVIIPILATLPGTSFYATSTPIGKTGKFFDLVKNRPDFKEMWLPSTVLPHWDEFKGELEYTSADDDGFKAEYMAEFVESTSGVFKSEDVVHAMRNYTYDNSDPSDAMWWRSYAGIKNRAQDIVTVIGIDWNKNAGSEFVVVCYDQVNHRWWVAESYNVASGKFNSVEFKNQVWRLNFKWKPDWIYADEGYGHHIIDDIHFEAHRITVLANHPDAQVRAAVTAFDKSKMQLGTKLKKFNFSQKVELVNPVDNTLLERTGKEFLVENTVRVFEEQRIGFPANDSTLRTQMLNYVVLRRHKTNNRPVYGMKNPNIGDHRLDALMLALGGLFLERHPLYSRNMAIGIGEAGLVKKEDLQVRADENPGQLTGFGVELLRIKRGTTSEGTSVSEMMNIEEQLKNPPGYQPGGSRKSFPSNPMGPSSSPSSVFEELWERSSSSNGYESDTRPLYELREQRRKSTPKPRGDNTSSAFVMKKSGRNSNRGRSGAW